MRQLILKDLLESGNVKEQPQPTVFHAFMDTKGQWVTATRSPNDFSRIILIKKDYFSSLSDSEGRDLILGMGENNNTTTTYRGTWVDNNT